MNDKTKTNSNAKDERNYNSNRNSKSSRRRNKFHNKSKSGSGNVKDKKVIAPENEAAGATNDISWYSNNPELLLAAAQVPYPYKPGMRVPFEASTDGTYTYDNTVWVPGVMSLEFEYSVGWSTDTMSPASIAAREMYAVIRSKFSGTLAADPPDIFMYCLALDQAHAYIAWLKRLYRTISTYSPQNRDYPFVVFSAYGVSNPGANRTNQDVINDLLAHKTRFWGVINELVHMVNKFVVPFDMHLYDRHRWMNEHVYLDEPNPTSQTYVFNPLGFLWVDETSETGTKLVKHDRPRAEAGVPMVDTLFSYGRSMIQALSDWDDSYTINGYIMRGYEGEQFYTAALLQADEELVPMYSEEVLTQIENFKPVGKLASESLTVSQNPNNNAIVHIPTLDPSEETYANRVAPLCLNLHTNNPTPAETVIATRMCGYADQDAGVHCGTEIPVSVWMTWAFVNSEGELTNNGINIPHVVTYNLQTTTWSAFNGVESIIRRMSFRHSPVGWIWIRHPNDNTTNSMFVGDIHNLTILNRDQLDEITRVCVYSEFNCFR